MWEVDEWIEPISRRQQIITNFNQIEKRNGKVALDSFKVDA